MQEEIRIEEVEKVSVGDKRGVVGEENGVTGGGSVGRGWPKTAGQWLAGRFGAQFGAMVVGMASMDPLGTMEPWNLAGPAEVLQALQALYEESARGRCRLCRRSGTLPFRFSVLAPDRHCRLSDVESPSSPMSRRWTVPMEPPL